MFKKLIIAATILTASTSVFANSSVYVGAGLGVATNTASNSNGSTGFFRGFPATVLAGWSTIVDPDLYLAGELSATMGTFEIENKNKMKTSYGYGISFVPGLMLGEHSVAFGKVGIVRSHFTNVSDSETGIVLGMGMQASMTQNIELRVEYNFTAYGDVSGIKSPRQDVSIASLVYRFD